MTGRPWTAATAAAAAVHDVYELVGGIGLPGQETVGLVPSVVGHAVGYPAWVRRAERDERAAAALVGLSIGAAVTHFAVWPTRRLLLVGRAEGLTEEWTRAYNVVLYGWLAAAGGAMLRELPRRRWPLAVAVAAGTRALLPAAMFRKVRYIERTSTERPRWWNRADRLP